MSLIERLRNKASVFVASDCNQAANEIERLTAESEAWEASANGHYEDVFRANKRIAELEAENEHLADIVEVHIGGIDVLQKRIAKLESAAMAFINSADESDFWLMVQEVSDDERANNSP